jgi:hypothetical protein
MSESEQRKASQIQKAKDGGLLRSDDTWAGGSRRRAARIKELEAEVAALRKRLDMTEPMTVTAWESFGSPHIRAEMAARALMQEWCDPRRALKLLGFGKQDSDDPANQNRILRSDEVLEILDSVMQPPKELWTKILRRAQENAILGTGDVSIRATEKLSQWYDWLEARDANACR